MIDNVNSLVNNQLVIGGINPNSTGVSGLIYV